MTNLKFAKSADSETILSFDEEKGEVVSRVSTESVDSDMEVVLSKGLNWSRFTKNPVVLFQHNPNMIIGKSLWQKVEKGYVLAKTKFAVHRSEMAKELFGLVKDGYVSGWSIGMDPYTLKTAKAEDCEETMRPEWKTARRFITKADVLEYSLVSIPANPDALTTAVEKGLIRATKGLFFPPVPKVRIVPGVRVVG